MSVVRAAILRVETPYRPRASYCYVFYKILKKGRKRERRIYLHARDEMEAYLKARDYLRERGYKT